MASTAGADNPPVTVSIDALADRHVIDPDIYGLNSADANTLNSLNSPLNRYGGNRVSRYNWQQNTDSTAMDWYFESYPDANPLAGGMADTIVQESHNANAEPMITIPMIDWIAKAGPGRTVLWSFSINTYGAQNGNDAPWYPDAGSGIRNDGTYVVGNDPNDANIPNSTAFQQTYVNHLIGKWGTAANGGVRYYITDNEHALWYDTHRDVHPQGVMMDDIRDKMIAYAGMVKSVDPGALIVGPEEYGWTGYFMSGYDKQQCEIRQSQGDFSCWANPPDRQNHGGALYIDWLLDQLHQHELNTGVRLLDVFSLHYYPQGPEYSDDVSTSTQLLRNRSTRSLWDPNYVDESWIGDKVKLIPRMKLWLSGHYPGLKMGLTEYGWGAQSHINGATTQADVLGILGKEGMDMATLYPTGDTLDPNSLCAKAFKMYRNYDGAKSTFGQTNVRTTVPNPDNISAFGAVRTGDGALTVMVISKYLSNNTQVTLNLANFQSTGTAHVWQLTSTGTIQNLADIGFGGSSFNATVPARSITLFVIPTANPTPDFNISCLPSTVQLAGQTTCSLTAQGGYNSSVTLSCSGLPAGATCGFNNNPVVVPGSSIVTVGGDVAAGDYPFDVVATDGANTHSSAVTLHVAAAGGALFADDFEDGVQSWIVKKGTWGESGGNLFSTTSKLSEIFSPPPYTGCTICTMEADIKLDSSGRTMLLGWYKDSKNYLELSQMADKKKWQLTHKMGGVSKKATVSQVMQPGATYHVTISYDGTKFQFSVNNVVLLPSFAPAGTPAGKVGFRVKAIGGASVTGRLLGITVHN